ncbi:protein-cysteine N-palmitoyltransferase HHAT-like protein isoform X3 [Rhipicephalus microplus]|uniref:protein-cysteine N-palmitoyltransferase HHAT-like protein isoform X3 n=1 Tax=Rhipicephalus microplus TaxID=6941 RepID=UPI003F6A783D
MFVMSESHNAVAEPKAQTAAVVQNGFLTILKKWESLARVFHWVIWTSGLVYVLGCFVTCKTNYTLPEVVPDEFVDGSYGISRDKDTADEEWYRYSTAIRRFWPWILVQPLISHCLFAKLHKWLPSFYVVYSTFFLLCNVGWVTTASFYSLYAAFYVSAMYRSTSLCYLLGLAVIIHSAFPVLTFLKPIYLYHGSVETFLTQVGLSWTAARCLSFAVDSTARPVDKGSPDIGTTLAYVFYLPALFTGPLQNYSDFLAQVTKKKIAWSVQDIMYPAAQVGLCTLYYFLLEFLLHYFYRHFDRGLYLWIQRYIYRPIVANGWTPRRRMIGAAASFAFVCSWHGMDSAVVVWCTLNFVGISTELLMEVIRNRNSWKKIEGTFFGGMRLQFLRAAVSAPHFLFSMFSCMFFLSNVDIGLIFFRRIICGYPIPLVPTLLVMYCGCHVSIDIMDWEVKKKKKS